MYPRAASSRESARPTLDPALVLHQPRLLSEVVGPRRLVRFI